MSDYFGSRNILITGGLGFLGSALATRLFQAGARITILDNLNPLYGGNLFNVRDLKDRVSIMIDDVRKIDVLEPLISRSEIVFHLAGQISYIDSLGMPYEDLDLNARATLSILECCRSVNPKAHVVFASSRMVYGKVAGPLVSESAATNPLSLYGIHKLTSEKYLLMYFKDFGIPVTILRLTNPFGPRQQVKHDKYSLVGWFIRQAMEGRVIRVFGDGSQLRDYIYVDDIVTSMLKCTAAPDAIGEVVNVGSGRSTRFRDMVTAVVKQVNRGKIEYIRWPDDYEKVETGDISVDISKLRRLTAWAPEYSLEEGIRRTHEYYAKYLEHYV